MVFWGNVFFDKFLVCRLGVIFYTAYLDDILVYSDTLDEHKIHVRRIPEALSSAGLNLKPEKCEFHHQEVKYLGIIVQHNGVRMDPAKVTTIVK